MLLTIAAWILIGLLGVLAIGVFSGPHDSLPEPRPGFCDWCGGENDEHGKWCEYNAQAVA